MSDLTPDLSAADGRWSTAAPEDNPATPAATVVALRDGGDGPEVLLLRRQRGGAFGGLWVFPGGKVEPQDFDAAGVAPGDTSPQAEVQVARHAAVREAEEEAALRLRPEDLEVHSYWIPPPEAARRFSTWFFVAGVAPGQAIVVDRAEVDEHRWVTPDAAMAQREAGTLPLAPPTWMTLSQLAGHASVPDAIAHARNGTPGRFETHIARPTAGHGTALVWPGDAAYDDGDLDRPGGRRRLWTSEDAPWRFEASDAESASAEHAEPDTEPE